MKVLPYPRQHRHVPASIGLARQAAANHEKATSSFIQVSNQSGTQTSGRCINKGARRSSVCTLPSRSWVTGLHYSPSHQHADQKGCACDRREEEISCRQSCNRITRIFQSNTLGHHSTHSHCRERGDTDSSKVWETLGVITMRFDYIANTTAVQLHLK